MAAAARLSRKAVRGMVRLGLAGMFRDYGTGWRPGKGGANGNVRGEYGMAERPILLVTRKLPPAAEERAARDYRARLNPEDAQFEAAALIAHSAGADAILTRSEEPTSELQ